MLLKKTPSLQKAPRTIWSTARNVSVSRDIRLYLILCNIEHFSMADIDCCSFQEDTRLHWAVDTSSLNDTISFLQYYEESYDNDYDQIRSDVVNGICRGLPSDFIEKSHYSMADIDGRYRVTISKKVTIPWQILMAVVPKKIRDSTEMLTPLRWMTQYPTCYTMKKVMIMIWASSSQ